MSAHHLISHDPDEIGRRVFSTTALSIHRVLFHIQSFKTFYIAMMICIAVKYIGQPRGAEQQQDYAADSSDNTYS